MDSLEGAVPVRLRIDPEFKALCRQQTQQERQLLVEDIEKNGILDPIWHWRGTVVDGHNRYEIAEEKNLSFNYKPIDFKDREEAIRWIIQRQLARRNLTPTEYAYLLGKQIKNSMDGNKSIYEAAKEADVPYHTARRAVAKAKELDEMPQEAKEAALKKRKMPPKNKPAPAKKEPKTASGENYPVHLKDVVESTTLSHCAELIEQVKRDVLRSSNGIEGAWLAMEPIKVALEQAASCLRNATYYAICPECNGKKGGCDECRRSGWMPRFRHDELRGKPSGPAVPAGSRRGSAK